MRFLFRVRHHFKKAYDTKHSNSKTERVGFKHKDESSSECSLCKENCATDKELTVHIKEHLDGIEEIDVESLKNGHEELKCSLCEFTSNDDDTVKTHLINHVPKPPEKSVRTAKTKKEQELIIKAGSLLDLYDDDGNPLYDSTDSDSISIDE